MTNQSYQTYKPGGKAPISGILLLIIMTTIAGVIVGLIAAGVAQFVYLVLAFPIFMITIGTGIVGQTGKAGKIRNRLVLTLAGFWIGMVIYGTYWTGEYLFLVEDFYQEYREDDYTRLDALNEVNEDLLDDTGYPHTIGYALWSIEGGLQLSGTSPGDDSSINLNPQQTAIYWSIEALAVVLLTGLMSFVYGNKPFSESCNKWYDKADTELLGYILNENGRTFVEYLRAGSLENAAQLVNTQGGDTEVSGYFFTDCNSDEVLLKAIRHQGRNTTEVDGIMSKSAYEHFKGLI